MLQFVIRWFLIGMRRQFNDKGVVFSTNCAGTAECPHAKEWSWTPMSHNTQIKMNHSPIWLRVKAMKLWEENVELNLYDFGLGSGSLDLISKAEISKEKLAVLSHMKIKHFCASKDTIKKMKTTHRMGEHVC